MAARPAVRTPRTRRGGRRGHGGAGDGDRTAGARKDEGRPGLPERPSPCLPVRSPHGGVSLVGTDLGPGAMYRVGTSSEPHVRVRCSANCRPGRPGHPSGSSSVALVVRAAAYRRIPGRGRHRGRLRRTAGERGGGTVTGRGRGRSGRRDGGTGRGSAGAARRRRRRRVGRHVGPGRRRRRGIDRGCGDRPVRRRRHRDGCRAPVAGRAGRDASEVTGAIPATGATQATGATEVGRGGTRGAVRAGGGRLRRAALGRPGASTVDALPATATATRLARPGTALRRP